MSKELDEIDEMLSKDDSLKQSIDRNRVLMDFNLLSSGNPGDINKIIFRVIIFAILAGAVWLISFYI